MPKDFSWQNLRGKSFKGQDLTGANFSGADIRGATFQNARLIGANFRGAKAGLAYPSFVIQIIAFFILTGFSGILSTWGGIWFTNLIRNIIKGVGTIAPDSDVVTRVTGGLSILLLGMIVVCIRKGRAAAGAAVAVVTAVSAAAVAAIVVVAGAGTGLMAGGGVGAVLAIGAGVAAAAAAGVGAVVEAVVNAVVVIGAAAVVVAGVVAGAAAKAEAIAGAVVVIGLVAGVTGKSGTAAGIWTADIIVIAIYMGWRTFHEDKQFAALRRLGVAFASLGGTNFQGADLTNADFSKAALKNTRFGNATVKRTCWQQTKYLKFARLNGTILVDRAVRELLITGDGSDQSFARKNLQGAYLIGANLNDVDLSKADLHGATLQNASIRETNLTETIAVGADFQGADLTGACLEAWNIDNTTQLEGAHASYVYLLSNKQERRPNSGTFGEREFSKLFQEVLTTVDFIFKNGIDWQAFLVTFDEIRKKIRVESEDADITVQSIENKGDGVFVIKVTVSENIDKETLHREIQEQYAQQLALQEKKYQSLLQGKEELIVLYRQQATDMKEILQTLMEKQTVNITGEVVLGNKRTIQTSRDYLEQVAGDVTTGASVSEPKEKQTGGSYEDAASSKEETREGRDTS